MTDHKLCIKKKRGREEQFWNVKNKDWKIKMALFDILRRIPLISFKCIFYKELGKNTQTQKLCNTLNAIVH